MDYRSLFNMDVVISQLWDDLFAVQDAVIAYEYEIPFKEWDMHQIELSNAKIKGIRHAIDVLNAHRDTIEPSIAYTR